MQRTDPPPQHWEFARVYGKGLRGFAIQLQSWDCGAGTASGFMVTLPFEVDQADLTAPEIHFLKTFWGEAVTEEVVLKPLLEKS